jgi:ASPIC and UnbV/FG-GAP-like repeat
MVRSIAPAICVMVALALLGHAGEATQDHVPRFEEIAEKAGLKRRHHTRTFQGRHADVLGMFTSGGAAAAAGDFDNDGDDDLFVTDSEVGTTNVLYRNDGHLKFTDITAEAGVGGGNDPRSIVADALWFDYDNDGWRDLLVARFGTPLLYHNERHGKFKEVSAAAGMTRFANTIAAIAFDYDRDGLLDLLFGNYFKPDNLFELKDPRVLPNDLDNAVNGGGVTLWRNRAGGRFEDATERAGLAGHTGWTLDVGHGDFDNDGLPDVYLANDYGTDRIYFNVGDGVFADSTEKSIGFDTRKGMNVDVGDYDNDGWQDIYVTNITDEYMKECNMLWHNNGDRTFTDLSRETGTCDSLWGWSAKFGDFDNDRLLDIFAVNGLRSAGPRNYIPVLLTMITTPNVDFSDLNRWPPIGNMTWSGYQKKKLFKNVDGHAFKEVAAAAGVDNDRDGRGLAVADFDGDGLLEFFQTNASQEPLLYHNVTSGAGNWIALDLAATTSNRDAIGARVAVKTASSTLLREVNGGNGYAGQSTRRVHVGLGGETKIDWVEIRWPSGIRQRIHPAVGRVTTVSEAAPEKSR